ncbi:MAG: DUF1501 domain-containing protein [Synechocystis sp.]|nr:DUF1501 domain-containing protein [Synechocystis sp.]
MKRRQLLQYGTLLGGALLLSVGKDAWMWRSPANSSVPSTASPVSPSPDNPLIAANSSPTTNKRLIVILLRGALDGLSVLVPYTDSNYYDLRPKTAIAEPGGELGALPLTQHFALHPALKSLLPLWQQNSLGFVVACGSPDPSRSHFDAQFYMESGTPGRKSTPDGWLNRLMSQLGNGYPVQGLNLGNITPQILAGAYPIASLPSSKRADRSMPLDNPQIYQAFDQLYAGNTAIAQVYQKSREARAIVMANLTQEMVAADQGAPPAKGFGANLQRIGQQMRNDAQIQVAFAAVGGWDTHVNQGNETGDLARKLRDLGDGLSVLPQSLGPVYDDTLVVVLSEFGRTVKENVTGGTDHGHGNVMWLMGGALQGGKIYGDWPGLAENVLYEQRDVPVVTDFRDPLWTIFRDHLGLMDQQITQILPDFSPQTALKGLVGGTSVKT